MQSCAWQRGLLWISFIRHIKSNSKLKVNLTNSCFKRQRTSIPDAIVKSLLSIPDSCLAVKRNFPKILIQSSDTITNFRRLVWRDRSLCGRSHACESRLLLNRGSENEGHLAHRYTLYNSYRSSTTLFLPKPVPEVFDWSEKHLSLGNIASFSTGSLQQMDKTLGMSRARVRVYRVRMLSFWRPNKHPRWRRRSRRRCLIFSEIFDGSSSLQT